MAPRYRLHPDVIWVERPDGSSRLIHLDRNICGLDSSSTRLLHGMLQDGVEGATQALAARSSRDQAVVRGEVDDFLGQLRHERILIAPEERATSLGGGREAAARAIIGAATRVARVPRLSTRTRARLLLWAAHWAVKCFRWGTTARMWEQLHPRPRVDASSKRISDLKEIDFQVRDVAARSTLKLECKERALTSLALARGIGASADLVMGLRYMPLQAHVWVTCGGRVVGDNAAICRTYEALGPPTAAGRRQ